MSQLAKDAKEIKLHQDRGKVQQNMQSLNKFTEALQHTHTKKIPRSHREKHAKKKQNNLLTGTSD
jgi:hypothetical protein